MALLSHAMSQNASLSIVEEEEVGGSLVLLTDREHIHARLFRVETKMKLFSP